MERLIDWFTPAPAIGVSARDRGRRRKLIAFLLVVLSVTSASVATQVGRGLTFALVGSALFTVVLLASLGALRLGASPWLVTCVVLFLGCFAAAGIAMSSPAYGIGSLFWIALAPLIALPIGGKRAGWITLVLAGAAIAIGLWGIEAHWVTSPSLERPFEAKLVSLLGVVLTAFLLSRAYEVETEASIAALKAQNEALDRAREQAARASRAKSDFLATMSHEIRTPLNGVTGMATLLRDETDPARIREGLHLIQQSADVLLAVISDVLDFSKIESNQLELEALPLSIARELRVVVGLFESAASEHGDDLQLDVDASVPEWIVGDPTRLRQVVTNLVANAVKFTSGGRVVLTAKARDGQLTFEVTDTGIGMSKEVRERLFNPFVQADASTTRRFGGSGLGLVISRRLVEAMSGTLTVQSEPGQGSVFTVTLPFKLAEAPRAANEVLLLASERRSVLVVEDNFVNQVIVVRLLEKLGHRVTVAADGEESLARTARETFDVVLMDCHMPVMDGFEATRRLRARGDLTPVFALTAAVTTEDRERCLRSGMTGVLSKPLRLELLYQVLLKLPCAERRTN